MHELANNHAKHRIWLLCNPKPPHPVLVLLSNRLEDIRMLSRICLRERIDFLQMSLGSLQLQPPGAVCLHPCPYAIDDGSISIVHPSPTLNSRSSSTGSGARSVSCQRV